MTTIVAAAPSRPTLASATNVPRLGAVAYLGAWFIGLTVFGTGPGAAATNEEIVRYFADHRVSTAVQGLLIHGVAAVALYVVLRAVARTRTSTRTAHVAGLIGVGLSLAQLVLDQWRSLISTGSTTTTLVNTIDRVDGLKMFAFAVMIGASITALRSSGMIGRRMAITGRAATGALIVSGVAYGAAINPLLGTAAVSLVLLLVWVANLGIAASRRAV